MDEAVPSFLPNLQQPPPAPHTDDEWIFEEIKIFEKAVAEFGLDHSGGLFERIAARLPRKTETQVRNRWEMLLREVEMIESGFIPIPYYKTTADPVIEKKPKRRGVPWTQEEHECFLIGLEKFGKGDWRSISRHCVKTKNPTQVASHAQKHFIRLHKSTAQQNPVSAAASNLQPSTSSAASAPYQCQYYSRQ